MRKPISLYLHPVQIQISLRFRAVRSESSLDVFWIPKDAKCLHVDNKKSDQTARMRRLIWVIVRRTCRKTILFRIKWYKDAFLVLHVIQYTLSANVEPNKLNQLYQTNT